MTLRYDASGLSPTIIGDKMSVSGEQRDALRARLEEALGNVKAAHERGELGFIDCPDFDAQEVQAWAADKRAQGFTDQVVIGIGGSSLGARAVYESMAELPDGGLRTHFAENVDPVGVANLFDGLDFSKTLFVVITKSGSTVETMTKFWYAWDRAVDELGEDEASSHFVAITGPDNAGLRALADDKGFDTFPVPPNVGGRFSVLTAVGLVPLALAGYDIAALVDGAGRARDVSMTDSVDDNAILKAAADMFELYERGADQVVMMAYSDQLLAMADWFRQLWAESLGKAKNRQGEEVNVGMTPIKALGAIDQHSQAQLYMEGPNDKHVVFLEVESFDREVTVPEREGLPESLSHLAGKSLGEILNAELQGTRRALQEAGRPTTTWRFDAVAPGEIGAFIFAWEFITAITGELLDINAFDQPGVELGKKLAHGLLGRQGFEEWAEMARSDEAEASGEEIG
ncbi:glucose-6-phosphate isomerase [Persicimonas caeni]|uniref:Glucose-6-phosphate isomerase n=1 Tax=Persicimonas caeni TaxID=2292766 RepID=A0A4Y6Q1R8_PERCE|nr:glucose-6-phosphate isomerase [Persicimonas caeni]QDG54503.1 glucose-6-phosphate isomerase [Persicimonas caeni]QED35724.1 glucose-6-phosphate isomerase [Persicimonas caeni]